MMSDLAQLTSLAEAIAKTDRAAARHLVAERVTAAEALGRVLAREIEAPSDAPPFDRALVDGYAVKAEETLGASIYNPLTFRTAKGGDATLPQAARIARGSRLPASADAVVPREQGEEQGAGETVELVESIAAGTNVERAGDHFARGVVLLHAGRRFGPVDLGPLAEAGIDTIDVVRRPHVRLVLTGPSGGEPGSERFDVEVPMLRGLIRRDGGTMEMQRTGRVCDDAIRKAVVAPGADIVIVVGGSGFCASDRAVREMLRRPTSHNGDGLEVYGIALRPGSPSGIGRIGAMPLFLLPDPPIACFWAYEMLAGRAVRRLAGRWPNLPYVRRDFVTVRKIVSSVGFSEIWPVRCLADGIGVEPISAAAPGGPAGLFPAVAQADGFVLVSEASEGVPSGTRVPVYLYEHHRSGPDHV